MMRLALKLLALLVLLNTIKADKPYKLTYRLGEGFNVSIGDTLVLQHTRQNPLLYVGIGQTIIKESRGNFFINNYNADRIGLVDFFVTNTTVQDTIQLKFGNAVNASLTLSSTSSHPLVVTIGSATLPHNELWFRVAATKDEQVYGLGEQYSFLNLRNKVFPIWTREQGVGRNKSNIVTFFADNMFGGAGGDYHTTYFPQPTFVSSRNYYCHYTGNNYMEYNLQPPTFHEVYITGTPGQFLFNTDTTVKGLVGKLATFLGKQPELPPWIYTGAILGIQGGTDRMLSRYNTSRQNNVPVSGLWIQDWVGVLKTSFGSRLFWDWVWNKQLYPNLDTVIRSLRQEGVRVLGYINPNVNVNGTLYAEGAPHGYFVKDKTGKPYVTDFGEFNCATVDLTNPAAYGWYKGKIQTNMIDLGLGGWMADFGEYLPADGVYFYSNQTGKDMHNKWPVLWAQLNRDAIDGRNKTGDVVFWMRAGGAGTGKYTTLMWAGDQNVDFSYGDGLPSTIPAALNMGMSGVGITHYDIGGYTTAAQLKAVGRSLVRTQELLLRSAEAAIFTPMFRSHEGNQPQANVQFYSTPYIERQFGRLASIYVFISNYTKSAVQDNAVFGTPVQRPLFMEFPNDEKSRGITYQYMFGSDMLVAPVIESHISSMMVYLPPGDWKYIWDTKEYSGGQPVNVSTPIGKPPAFYKKTSVHAPMFAQIQIKFPLIPTPVTVKPYPTGPTNTASRMTTIALHTMAIVTASLYQWL